MADTDTYEIDPATGRLTIQRAGAYRIGVPLVNADWTAGETATAETVRAFYADLAAKRAEWVGGPRDGQPVTQEDMDAIALAVEAAVLVPDAVQRIADLEAALHALVDREPDYGTDTGIYCVYCDAEQSSFIHPLVHEPDCPVVKARALLKAVDAP